MSLLHILVYSALSLLTLHVYTLYTHRNTGGLHREARKGFLAGYLILGILIAVASSQPTPPPENFSAYAERMREKTISLYSPPSHPVPKTTGTQEIDLKKNPEIIPSQG